MVKAAEVITGSSTPQQSEMMRASGPQILSLLFLF